MLLVSLVLAMGAGVVALVCAGWIRERDDLGSSACWALGLSVTALVKLAGYSNRLGGIFSAITSAKGTPNKKGKG